MILVGVSCGKAAPKVTFENLGALDAKEGSPIETTKLVVHVAGAVKNPGVHELKENARVHDAVREAGGAKPNADLEQWNLAAKVTDGMYIYVPAKGEKPKDPEGSELPPEALRGNLPLRIEIPPEFRRQVTNTSKAPRKTTPAKSKDAEPKGQEPKKEKEPLPALRSVSINDGTMDELETVPGIGPSTAQKIVQYRKEHNGFVVLEELVLVPGIGPAKLASIRKYLRL